ncbi:sacsin N-terminal ATP-binding-like domain-containing protein [Gordonia sp. DT218]|uniref:sacsin N-terminal ATP-binding-like domain-containing protein n=1 Tax=Gordonia sp. DT218 TaxID=3416659 RepID=UPI003CF8BE95
MPTGIDPCEPDDPFALDELRAATLDAWRASPTRFAEDAAAEQDLVTVGYRDRLFIELAANAADAASASDSPGRLAVWLDGRALHVANTGAPLTVDGVRSLLSLRVSAKRGDLGRPSVGRFGVGFTATGTVADRIEIRSRSGSFVVDRDRTAQAARDAGVAVSGTDRMPLLRLAWALDVPPVPDHDTEVVLHLRDDVSADALLAAARAQAPDLLLELVGLEEISVAGSTTTIDRGTPVADARTRRLTITETAATDRVVRTWIEADGSGTRWLIEAGESGPRLADRDVLRAPTPTDIELSLPARCITDLPLTPDRRHLHPDADIATAATGHADLMTGVPASWRPLLIPSPARARNRDDAALIEAVLGELRDSAWLPAAEGADLVPSRAVVLPDLSEDLAAVLAPVLGDLAHPDVSERRHLGRLRTVGVGEIGLADIAERLVGVERESEWWRDLYAALSPFVTTGVDADELGALPIPRADGRMNIGARGVFVADGIDIPMRWIPTVATAARHPLVERLGAQPISVDQVLADPALAQLVDKADDDELVEVTDEVFALLAADPAAAVPDRLSRLPVPDQDGELRAADELLLPDSPLASVLVADAPFGLVSDDLVRRVGPEVLRRLGVGWGFHVLVDDLPVAPDHDLPDEEQWWDTHDDPPQSLSAVRDLDLVDENRWRDALTLLATDDAVAPLLADRAGYTAWWLRHHALIDEHPLGWYRAPSDTTVEGVRAALDHPQADVFAAALGTVDVESAADADAMLTGLGDPGRQVAAGVAGTVYASVVRACRSGLFLATELAVPQRVRAVSGATVERAAVLDRPWLIQSMDPDTTVVLGGRVDADDAGVLADILDLPTVSEEARAVVRDEGIATTWTSTEAVLFAAEWGRDLGHGEVRIHDELWIRLQRNGSESDVEVTWWVDDRGVTHLARRFPR